MRWMKTIRIGALPAAVLIETYQEFDKKEDIFVV